VAEGVVPQEKLSALTSTETTSGARWRELAELARMLLPHIVVDPPVSLDGALPDALTPADFLDTDAVILMNWALGFTAPGVEIVEEPMQ